MRTKVEIDSYMPGYFSMRDLSRESNGASWPPYYVDNNIPNGQYYGFVPRTTSDSHSEYGKDVVKQTMLEHEVVFKNQVFELHRLYQVQRDLMDEVRRKEQIKHRIPYETSSSSSHVPSYIQHEDMRRWNSPAFPLASSFADRSIPGTVQSSPLLIKGKSIQAGPSPFQNCSSPKNSEVSESRPTKCRRKMFDLQLPADEYIDPDEVEQFGEAKVSDSITPSPDKSRFVCEKGKSFLNYPDASRSRVVADLNEPLNVEETTVVSSIHFPGAAPSHSDVQYRDCPGKLFVSSKDFPQRSVHRSLNGVLSNTPFENGSNGRDWFCYPSESEHKGNVRSINKGMPSTSSQPMMSLLDQLTQPPAFLTRDHIKGDLSSHVPNRSSLFHPADLGQNWNKPSGFFSSQEFPVTNSPFLDSKSPQSSAQSNYVFGNKWNLNSTPGANASYGGEPSARNGFYQGSTFKDLPGRVAPVNFDDVKPARGVNSSPIKGINLNVPYSNGISKVVDNKHESKDPLSVIPWLRGNGSCSSKEAENSKNGPFFATISCDGDVKSKKPKSGDFPSSRKILGVPIFEKPPTPKKEEIECSWRKSGFDMNLPCELSDSELDDLNVEVVLDEKRTQSESANVRNDFDLNLCVTEEESPRGTASSLKGDTGIDLEAPVMVESDEDIIPEKVHLTMEPEEKRAELVTAHADNGEAELATSAAETIVALSSSVNQSQAQSLTKPTCLSSVEPSEEEMLRWFVDIACTSGTDPETHMIVDLTDNNGDRAQSCLPEVLDEYESMILRLKECSVEEYFPKPSIPEFPNMEVNGPCMLTTRTRKGHARRGRQRRDFQRDILPGLTSLSRHEVTEDLQTFGGLMRATGHPWHSAPNRRNATRNGCGRGRRRSVVVAPAPAHTGISPPKQVSSGNTEVVLEDRCLTGWGKTTRRPRRQRCPSGNPPPCLASQLRS